MGRYPALRGRSTCIVLGGALLGVGCFGGFHGFSGFHGASPGGSRFGDGGFSDRSTDAGFGRGGYGSVHNASSFNDRADSFSQSHPKYQHNATTANDRADTFSQNHPDSRQDASQFQQNRTN